MKSNKVLIMIILIFLIFNSSVQCLAENRLESPENIHVIPIKGVVSRGLTAFVIRSIREAEKMNARALIFEIDTPGGEVGSAIQMSNAILKTSIPTIGLINSEATSAGVIIAISSEMLMAVPGATIGAAETRPKEEKYIAYWSSALRGAAEKTGRDPKLVAAMADADVVIEGVKEKGKILSLTTVEAIDLGLIDEQVEDLEELIQKVAITEEIDDIKILEQTMNFSERIAYITTNPYIAPVLLTIGIVGAVTEILTPGFGIPGIIALIAFGLFFGGNLIVGATKSWVLGLFILGLLLLVIEMFIPGFGVFGVSGILSIIASVVMAFPSPEQAFVPIMISFVVSGVIIYLLVKYLIKTPFFDRIVLGVKQEKSEGYTVSDKDESGLLGMKGKAITSLRPAGAALINERKIDVLTEGEFVPVGSDIVVIRVEGSKIIVKSKEKENV